MSLYLAIFDGENDVAGWVFGHYSDFGCFRDTIAAKLRSEDYPTLMTHTDCDGDWSTAQLPNLRSELDSIAAGFRRLPAEDPKQGFEHTAQYRQGARSLYECFHNVDGENIFEALIALCDEGIRLKQPITFQ
ncbi:MAG: immunity 70 family protein [Chthoniobacter sp.]|nr:immunity 70 family protein [Chthoniobacter sp.]